MCSQVSPVLVYEPKFPRNKRFRWTYLLEKTALCIGLITSGMLVLDE